MIDKKTIDRWNDFQPIYTPPKKSKKTLSTTTEKEMFSSTWGDGSIKFQTTSTKPDKQKNHKGKK